MAMPSRDERDRTLAECALRAPDIAAKSCDASHGCAPYHAIWPTMRLLEVIGSPDAPEDLPFWQRALDGLSTIDQPRVLLSGAADHGFLELVHGVLAQAGVGAKLCLVDRCATPLQLNRWYAENAGIELEMQQSDILSFARERRFDAVLAHSFIDQIPSEHWPALLARWHDLVRPGGRVVTLNRLRRASEAEAERASAAAPHDYAAMIARKNRDLPASLGIPSALAAHAERYWQRRMPTPFRSRGEIVALLENAGFSIEAADEGFATVAGRSFSKSRRLRLIARRP